MEWFWSAVATARRSFYEALRHGEPQVLHFAAGIDQIRVLSLKYLIQVLSLKHLSIS